MERRVVSQLALAYERQLISSGCKLKLTVDNHECNQMTKDHLKNQHKDPTPPHIKLQIVQKGVTKDKYIDVNFDSDTSTFS